MIVDGRPLVTTASIGVSLYPRDGSDMGELLRHSDTAMYQAKDRGRNNFQFLLIFKSGVWFFLVFCWGCVGLWCVVVVFGLTCLRVGVFVG